MIYETIMTETCCENTFDLDVSVEILSCCTFLNSKHFGYSSSFLCYVQVHCQGGKGRSGTFCSSLLIWTGFETSAAGALASFARRRMDERIKSHHYQGVSSPSQIRYVNYIEKIVRNIVDYTSATKQLISYVKIQTMPFHKKSTLCVSFIIESLGSIQYDHAKRHGLTILSKGSRPSLEKSEFKFDTDGVLVSGDATIRFYWFEEQSSGSFQFAELGPGARTIKYGNTVGKELCFVTFHTAFHSDALTFSRSEVDGVYDRPTYEFMEDFSVSVVFEDQTSSSTHRKRLLSKSLSETKSNLENILAEKFPTPDSPNFDETLSIPYGCSPGLRFLRLHDALEKILKAGSMHSLYFKRGQIMYDPRDNLKCDERSLFMIVSGSAEYDNISCDDYVWRINRGDSIRGLPLGVGDFYGELAFLLGSDGDPQSFCIRATSECTQVFACPLINTIRILIQESLRLSNRLRNNICQSLPSRFDS